LVVGGHMWPARCGERYDRRHTQAMEAIHTFTGVPVCLSTTRKRRRSIRSSSNRSAP